MCARSRKAALRTSAVSSFGSVLRAKFVFLLITVLPAFACVGPVTAAENAFDMGPGGVLIEVRLTERISSQDALSGQTFGFETTAAVSVDGTRIPAHTPGTGVVAFARSGRGPQPGKLRLAATGLRLANGKTLAVGLRESEAGTVSAADTAHAAGLSVPSSIGTVVVGGITRGNNVVYEKGARFTLIAPPPATPQPEPESEAT